ncbi:MAG: hypothetical protein HN567_00035 [Actinobacteria bacterium]|nr:hypothetical protein [Actinomycetota bacterium]MBT4476256.1 hypothetical protein [Actinomycetota bacterium]MBT4657015.1 hypothetical protein [Actinomycetota bacterium]MBT5504949.1 hypothetical protein [Actinomycetota bacterium]MBT7470750.1 hypothetical protein [Actinomycetota bacterium]
MAATSALAEELPPGSLDIDTAVASVPGLGILLDATEATIADGVDIHAPGSNAVVYVSDNGGVEIPDDPTIGVTLTGPMGHQSTLVCRATPTTRRFPPTAP